MSASLDWVFSEVHSHFSFVATVNVVWWGIYMMHLWNPLTLFLLELKLYVLSCFAIAGST